MENLQQSHTDFPLEFGRYYLLSPLAKGGMGALYLAAAGEAGMPRLVAIKTVLPHLADEEYKARFRDEAKVVVKLAHSNLVPVFDAGTVGGELFVAMEYVAGQDLRAIWNRCAQKRVAFPVDVAVYLIRELCRGLAYAHSFPTLGLVHRDVSPPNVMVSYSGEVKLTDFGLATSTIKTEKTAPGVVYGKVSYMSPEQARGEELDGRSDQYALGIVLWELLTGRQLYPSQQDKPKALIDRAKNEEAPLPSTATKRVGAELDVICSKSLSPLAENRYKNLSEMQRDLTKWLSKHAPTTDSSRIQGFLRELFIEDIEAEETRNSELLDTLKKGVTRFGGRSKLPLRQQGKTGRRADDRGAQSIDRRLDEDRRNENKGVGSRENPLGTEELVGSVLDGRYRVERLIGEGGMGRVYSAEHVEIAKRVAIKVLHPVYQSMPDLVERFRREARAAASIGNKHIVDITDSGTTADGSAYFVMEYLEGKDLCDVLEEKGALEIPVARELILQVCDALASAHAAGIVHRDLKPENLLVTHTRSGAPFVKILDFGIAKNIEAEEARERKLTTPGVAVGTPEYMAPEQAAGRPADVRSDVYSVGAILYEMLVGRPPYSGENFMEILSAKATVDPPLVNSLNPQIPQDVSDVVAKSMARNPSERPQTMLEMSELVSRFSSEPTYQSPEDSHRIATRAMPAMTADLPVMEAKQSRWLLWSALTVLALAGAAAAVYFSGVLAPQPAPAFQYFDAAPDAMADAVPDAPIDARPIDASRKLLDAAVETDAAKVETVASSSQSSAPKLTKKERRAKAKREAASALNKALAGKKKYKWRTTRQSAKLALRKAKDAGDSGIARRANYLAALSEFQLGNNRAAYGYVKNAGSSSSTLLLHGHILTKLGKKSAARNMYQKVLAKDPKGKNGKAAKLALQE